jgi:membrane-associated phospholipid phosphatase
LIGPQLAAQYFSVQTIIDPHFNMRIMELFAAHRNPLLTFFFTAMSGFGDGRWYLLVVLAIYVAWDKRLAVRLSILMTLSGSVNYILKMLIANPRPFVRDGTYLQKWAIPARNAATLAAEFSTPSGHAMSAASFYSFLGASARQKSVRIAAMLIILLVGVSRPYLGVHYVEDVLLGWAIGIALGLLSFRYADTLAEAWSGLRYDIQIAAALAISALFCLIAMAVNHGRIDAASVSLLSDVGMFTGIVVACPLELKFVDFDATGSSASFKALRFTLSVLITVATVALCGRLIEALGLNVAGINGSLQFARYCLGGIVSFFVAPWIFTRIGLAQRTGA